MSQVRKLKGAKQLAYEVTDDGGTVWARALSLPLAEKVAELVDEQAEKTAEILARLEREELSR